jgi:4'-phosphopantetheinyl transferase
MSLLSIYNNPDNTIAVWKTEEDISFFMQSLQPDIVHQLQLEKFTYGQKKLEQLSSRYLLQTIIGEEEIKLLRKAPNGMPYLESSANRISISHTKNHSAVIVASNRSCGIDIETIHERVRKVAHKFLNAAELEIIQKAEKETAMLTLFWSAKETIYKIYAKRMVDFSEHIILSNAIFTSENKGQLQGMFQKENERFEVVVSFEFIDGQVLTYAVV